MNYNFSDKVKKQSRKSDNLLQTKEIERKN